MKQRGHHAQEFTRDLGKNQYEDFFHKSYKVMIYFSFGGIRKENEFS